MNIKDMLITKEMVVVDVLFAKNYSYNSVIEWYMKYHSIFFP